MFTADTIRQVKTSHKERNDHSFKKKSSKGYELKSEEIRTKKSKQYEVDENYESPKKRQKESKKSSKRRSSSYDSDSSNDDLSKGKKSKVLKTLNIDESDDSSTKSSNLRLSINNSKTRSHDSEDESNSGNKNMKTSSKLDKLKNKFSDSSELTASNKKIITLEESSDSELSESNEPLTTMKKGTLKILSVIDSDNDIDSGTESEHEEIKPEMTGQRKFLTIDDDPDDYKAIDEIYTKENILEAKQKIQERCSNDFEEEYNPRGICLWQTAPFQPGPGETIYEDEGIFQICRSPLETVPDIVYPVSDRRVYVGGLPFERSEREIAAYLRDQQILDIETIDSVLSNGSFTGVVYITFYSPSSAKRILSLDGTCWMGHSNRYIVVKPYVPNEKENQEIPGSHLHMGNLAFNTKRVDIEAMLASHIGPVDVSINLSTKIHSTRGTAHAFLRFEKFDHAVLAVNLNHTCLKGKNISLAYARHTKTDGSDDLKTLFIRGLDDALGNRTSTLKWFRLMHITHIHAPETSPIIIANFNSQEEAETCKLELLKRIGKRTVLIKLQRTLEKKNDLKPNNDKTQDSKEKRNNKTQDYYDTRKRSKLVNELITKL